jgi:DNA-binding HxlR family transcriptional regulator
MFSNPYRVLILGYLPAKNHAGWWDIREFLEEHLGPVDPNTLSFHLKALIQRGHVTATGRQDKPVYQVGQVPPDTSQAMDSVARRIGGG